MEVAIENLLVQLQPHELRRRLMGLTALVEATRDLAAEIDLDQILQTITHRACLALDCERASLFQYDARRHELHTRVVTELEISEIRNKIDNGITGYVARTREVTNVSNPAEDPRWNSSVDLVTGFRTLNILAVPISTPHDARLLGVLEMINKRGRAFDEFDEELAQAFGQHASAALDRARLVDELRRRSSTEASLSVAREIQRGFMPSELPKVAGYEMATWWFPNEEVGGDYCDVVRMRDGRLGLIVADVSGHGLGPSLIMASLRAGLRALMLEHARTDVLMGNVAHSMSGDLREGRFITMVLAALDPEAHSLEFSNAGHAPALHYNASTGKFTALEATGLPLGVLERPVYPPGPPVFLGPGDVVVLCTDGIVEAMDANEEQFGMDRLKEIIAAHAGDPCEDLVRHIGGRVTAHYVGENPPDDLTVLAMRRLV